ncbi:EAL domain-containing protein [Cupriavidus sp. 30B13]|uniref:EAL domain-containing protein n=1 Tax=Cupriavidus sp. 30B13 TaxID=3384241 RepID=UPI003B91D8C4
MKTMVESGNKGRRRARASGMGSVARLHGCRHARHLPAPGHGMAPGATPVCAREGGNARGISGERGRLIILSAPAGAPAWLGAALRWLPGVTVAFADSVDGLLALLESGLRTIVFSQLLPGSSEGLFLPSRLVAARDEGRLAAVPPVVYAAQADGHGLASHARLAGDAGVPVHVLSGRSPRAVAGALARIAASLPDVPRGAPSLRGAAAAWQRSCQAAFIDALDKDAGFRIVVQPQFSLQDGRIVGAEALSRWSHPDFGAVSPATFIPWTQDEDRAQRFFFLQLERVIAVLRRADRLGGAVPIAVNVPCSLLSSAGFAPALARALVRASLPASLIKLELTESEPVLDELALSSAAHWLRANGFGVSMDDFGTGAASLKMLCDMPFDEMKIDGALVRRMADSPALGSAVAAAVNLGLSRGMTVVAEGIESAQAIAALRAAGCMVGQGYALCRPLEAPEYLKRLAAGGRLPGLGDSAHASAAENRHCAFECEAGR